MLRKVYCPNPNCRNELKEIIKVSAPLDYYKYNIERGVFTFDRSAGVEETFYICPHCEMNLSDYVEVDSG